MNEVFWCLRLPNFLTVCLNINHTNNVLYHLPTNSTAHTFIEPRGCRRKRSRRWSMQPKPMVWELFELIVVVQVREVAAEKMQ